MAGDTTETVSLTHPTTDLRDSRANLLKSPFFEPSTSVKPSRTPGGTPENDAEHKSSVLGASSNLLNGIVGSGIVGIAYAVKQSGLVAGVLLIIVCAIMNEKSLRMLIESAKYVSVPSYERLMEVSFGRPGFLFVSINMFLLAFGALISYLMVVRDTLPIVLGFDADDLPVHRAIVVIASLLIMLPLCMQRDIADLAKTSKLANIFAFVLVVIVAKYSPKSYLAGYGGDTQLHQKQQPLMGDTGFIKNATTTMIQDDFISPNKSSTSTSDDMWSQIIDLVTHDIVHPKTIFLGVGVLSFAFVCQHQAFIIAGSLDRPTRKRWGMVTRNAAFGAGILSAIIGVTGYLGFGGQTQGNILNNFVRPETMRIANIARGCLSCTMFFVYPLECFVARHICVVLLFKGRKAHDGDDHAVLKRDDRRRNLTLALYISSLIPALFIKDLGTVLGLVGCVGGSCLTYIGPGSAYLAIHGDAFLDCTKELFGLQKTESFQNLTGWRRLFFQLSLMPMWTQIAVIGHQVQIQGTPRIDRHMSRLKSPTPMRLASPMPFKKPKGPFIKYGQNLHHPSIQRADSLNINKNTNDVDDDDVEIGAQQSTTAIDSIKGITNKDIAATIYNSQRNPNNAASLVEEIIASRFDFFIAIFYIIFGAFAVIAGLISTIA